MGQSETEYVLVTEYFHPDTASTGQLMTDLAVGLKERGLNMTVYTGQPNYHSGDNEKQPRKSRHEGVLVKRIAAPQVRQSSMPRRLFNWTVFTLWMAVTLLFDRTSGDREIIFVSNPPFLPVVLWPVCRIRGWEYTYIAYDLYPDEPVELDFIREGGLAHRIWAKLDQYQLHDAKNIVALGPAMRDRLSRNAGTGFDSSKIHIIHNWEDETFIEPMPKEENWFSENHDLVEPFTILYSGNMAHFHDLETVIDAAQAFEDEDVKFLLIGEGDNKQNLISRRDKAGLEDDTVEFLPYQPWDDLPYSLTSADVSIVAVNEGFEGIVVSSKLYTSMATGQPVLGIAQPYSDEARIIEEFDAGKHVPQGDVEGAIEAVNSWKENPEIVAKEGANAREAFEENFTKDHSIDAYYEMLTTE